MGKLRHTRRNRMSKRHTKKHKRTRRGHKKKRGTRKRMRGGGTLANLLIPLPFGQEIVNMGRVVETGAKNVYRGYKGVPKAVNPLPTKGQFKSRLHFDRITPPNINKIRKNAVASVNQLESSL